MPEKFNFEARDISVHLSLIYLVGDSQDFHSFQSDVLLDDAMRLLNLFLINPAIRLDSYTLSDIQFPVSHK